MKRDKNRVLLLTGICRGLFLSYPFGFVGYLIGLIGTLPDDPSKKWSFSIRMLIVIIAGLIPFFSSIVVSIVQMRLKHKVSTAMLLFWVVLNILVILIGTIMYIYVTYGV